MFLKNHTDFSTLTQWATLALTSEKRIPDFGILGNVAGFQACADFLNREGLSGAWGQETHPHAGGPCVK